MTSHYTNFAQAAANIQYATLVRREADKAMVAEFKETNPAAARKELAAFRKAVKLARAIEDAARYKR